MLLFFFQSLGCFTVLALASLRIGQIFSKLKFPLISGYLFAGIFAGPYILEILTLEQTSKLRFIDDLSLAFIAFAAGSELNIKELTARIASIRWIIVCQLLFTFFLGSLTLYLCAPAIPFMNDFSEAKEKQIAIALLAGTILMARSPSSAIAVIKEFRAKGPFTQTILGVTVVMDVVVIILFAINISIANTLLAGQKFNLSFVFLLLGELFLSFFLGYLVNLLLKSIFKLRRIQIEIKTFLMLLLGYGTFVFCHELHHYSHNHFKVDILLEPLLICMVGACLFSNYCKEYTNEFLRAIHVAAPFIYLIFFTITGASLTLDVLAQLWPITLLLFFVRIITIFFGSFIGGMIAGDPMPHNRVSWMTYVTQAGVGLGLAKEVSANYPGWGSSFGTLIISVIIVNQIVGPAFFKWALFLVKEGKPHAKKSEFGIPHHAIIFGNDGQAIALARQLRSHHWSVQIVCKKAKDMIKFVSSDPDIFPIKEFNLEELKDIGSEEAGAIVVMLDDEESFQICQIVQENFAEMQVIVQLTERANSERFQKIGVNVVAPSTAIISLLDHFVRTPSAVSLLLGMEENQDIIDLEIRNPYLDGLLLRELRLTENLLILSVHRGRDLLPVNGSLQFRLGDLVTLVGPPKTLEEITPHFSS